MKFLEAIKPKQVKRKIKVVDLLSPLNSPNLDVLLEIKIENKNKVYDSDEGKTTKSQSQQKLELNTIGEQGKHQKEEDIEKQEMNTENGRNKKEPIKFTEEGKT